MAGGVCVSTNEQQLSPNKPMTKQAGLGGPRHIEYTLLWHTRTPAEANGP